MPEQLTALDVVHAVWTCVLLGWTAWLLRATPKAQRIVADAESRARARGIEAESAARRVVAAAVQRAIRLGDRGIVVGRLR